MVVHSLGVFQSFWQEWNFSAHGNWFWTKNVKIFCYRVQKCNFQGMLLLFFWAVSLWLQKLFGILLMVVVKFGKFLQTRGHFWHTFDVWQPGVCIEFWQLKASRVINCILFWKICYKNCGSRCQDGIMQCGIMLQFGMWFNSWLLLWFKGQLCL